MKQPLISIITPIYNAERFIEETIASVKNQTYTHWELLLVDDASTDRSSARLLMVFSRKMVGLPYFAICRIKELLRPATRA